MKYIIDDEHHESRPRGSGVAAKGPPGAHRIHDRSATKTCANPASWCPPKAWRGPSRPSWCGPARTARRSRTAYFPRAKEFLAGYWIVDVESPERAYAIAAQASAAPGPGGAPLNMPIEVRQVMSGPARRCCDESAMPRPLDADFRASVARTRAAGARRGRSAVSAISPPPRTRCRRRCWRPSLQWPREGVPDNPRGWLIQVASRRMTDHVRSEMARRERETAVAMEAEHRSLPPPSKSSMTWIRTTR